MYFAAYMILTIYLVKPVFLEKCERNYQYNEKVRNCPFEIPGNGTILDRGVCIEKSYDSVVRPKPKGMIENTTRDEMKSRGAKCWDDCKICCVLSYSPIFTTINHHMVRDINDKRRTLTLDLSLTLSWMDHQIKTYKPLTVNQDQAKLREISLPLSRHLNIWKPDLHVYNLSDYKSFKGSINGVGLKILATHYQDNGFCLSGPMVSWEIEAKIKFYCELDYSYYPMDRSICKLRFGSRRSDTKFILHDMQDNRFNLEMYRLLDFNAMENEEEPSVLTLLTDFDTENHGLDVMRLALNYQPTQRPPVRKIEEELEAASRTPTWTNLAYQKYYGK